MIQHVLDAGRPGLAPPHVQFRWTPGWIVRGTMQVKEVRKVGIPFLQTSEVFFKKMSIWQVRDSQSCVYTPALGVQLLNRMQWTGTGFTS